MQKPKRNSTSSGGRPGNGTRRQHHVWRSYLEAWATDGKVFCLQAENIFRPNVTNVAVERDFYKLHTLTDADIYGIRLLMKNSPASAQSVLENFLAMFGMPGRLKANPLFAGDDGVLALIDHQIINAEEELHAQLEGNIKPVLDAMRRKDLSFYDDPKLCGQFAHFLSLQNLRTKGVREKVLARATEQHGFSLERCWNIVTHMMAVNAGGSLLLERKKRPLLLLENHTDIPFVTGDQPVVNLLHAPISGDAPTLLAFYYPISPWLAVILDEMEERTGFRAGAVSVEQVTALNREIQAAAHKQIFGHSDEILKSLIPSLAPCSTN